MNQQAENLKTTNRFLIVGLIISAFLIGSLTNKVSTNKTTSETTTAETTAQPQAAPAQPQAVAVDIDTIKSLFTEKHIYFGNKDSKNLFVEIADPSCPYCHIAGGNNPELNKEAGSQFTMIQDGGDYLPPVLEMKKMLDQGDAAFVYIYSPGHGNGEMGMKAMYCAHEQGKFWEVHDKLMSSEGYTMVNDNVKNDVAKSAELAEFLSDVFDASAMQECLESGRYDSKIAEDTETSRNLGVSGTPGFFINSTNFAGAYSWNDMQSAVN
jgi:protein-disulfide isomerase